MFSNVRPVLWLTLLLLGFMLWSAWQQDFGPQVPQTGQPQTQGDLPGDLPGERSSGAPAAVPEAAVPDESVPSAADLPDAVVQETPAAPAGAVAQAGSPTIRVQTDVLNLEIALDGGTVVGATLLDYPVSTQQPEEKVTLLSDSLSSGAGGQLFVAQSGLVSSNRSAPDHTQRYQADRESYRLPPQGGELGGELVVPLRWQGDGVEVIKRFRLRPGDYTITVEHEVINRSQQPWSGSHYQQLQRTAPLDRDEPSFTDPGRYSYVGGAVYSPEDKYEKIDFGDMIDDPYQRQFSGGWLAMVQHYFFSAWIPPEAESLSYSSQHLGGTPDRYLLRAVSPARNVAPGAAQTFSSQLYVGPKLQEQLDEIAPGLSLTVDYGIFTIFSKPLFWLLSKLHILFNNWGFAIIGLVVLIKLAFFKLTEAQYRSMARMRQLQPRVESLKERYGDDRQKMSQAMMELYRKEKVNPLGGCLPMLIQIPIFIALYWVLLESVELRQAPFILWIQDLSERDPYFVLPVLNGVFMILTQRLTPTTGMDPTQRKIMNALPVVFSVLFAFFPAGLVLYWATNAGLSLLQQWYITRKLDAAGKSGAKPAAKR